MFCEKENLRMTEGSVSAKHERKYLSTGKQGRLLTRHQAESGEKTAEERNQEEDKAIVRSTSICR
eukprot:7786859-Ditylum_brightwellii.AAC.1